MNSATPLRVLLIDDDEDVYVLVRDALAEADSEFADRWRVDWAPTYELGLEGLLRATDDVVLLDYRLGIRTGLELLAEAGRIRRQPVIMLTSQATSTVDLDAMTLGVVDFLEKDQIKPAILERALRYAVEREKVGLALRESEARLQDLVRQVPGRLWTTGRDLVITWIGGAAEVAAGTTARVGTHVSSGLSSHQRDVIQAAHDAALAGRSAVYEVIVGPRTWQARTEPLRDEAGESIGVIGFGLDVTDARRRTRIEAARYRVTALVSNAADLASIGPSVLREIATGLGWDAALLWLPDDSGQWLALASASDDAASVAPNLVRESVGMRFEPGAFLPGQVWLTGQPQWVSDVREKRDFRRLNSVRQDGLAAALSFPIRAGSVVHGVVSMYSRQVVEPDIDLLAALADIGEQLGQLQERKRIENERDRLILALQQSADGIAITDRDACVVFANRAFQNFAGLSEEQLIGLPASLGDVALPVGREDVGAQLNAGNSWSGAINSRRPDGTALSVDVTMSPIRDSRQANVGTIVAVRDMTRERAVEERLNRTQRMEAIGQLAGGIAHDFNNLLTGVAGYADLLALACEDGDPRIEDIEQIRVAARRGSALVQQLLAFARMQRLAPVKLDMNEVIGALLPMLHRLIGEHIEIRADLDAASGHVEVDRSQLEQVIVNLAVNARDAMPDGGTLTIRTTEIELSGAEIQPGEELVPGRYLKLSVSDTGIGMDADTRARAFEPFFTTKGLGKGTGLGLATVYGIVRQSRGYVWLYSEPGHGTAVRVILPRVEAVGPESTASTVPTTDPNALVLDVVPGTTILLVEDEHQVRALTRRVLEQHGYRVLEASRGDEAVSIIRAHADEIDLLLTDFVMPGLNGWELWATIARPAGVRHVVFMSGYSNESLPESARDLGYISKPFSPNALTSAVHSALHRHEGPPDVDERS